MAATPLSGNPDVFVIGGGPAGATAARLLATWGWSVQLADRTVDRPRLSESLPASTRKLLTFLGQGNTIQSACFQPNFGNVARWAGTLRVTSTDEAGFHVSRASFDSLLRHAARAAGVSIIDAAVRGVRLGEEPRAVYVTSHRDSHEAVARMVLDCSGRSGIVARRGFRRTDVSYRTLALTADWESDSWPVVDATRTIVESYAEGWAWSVPLSRTQRQVTVMIDPLGISRAKDVGPRERALQCLYTRALASTAELGPRLESAQQRSRPWGMPASLYHSPTPCDRGLLIVGDAASFIEPLSSAGVKKAMTSGWRAAVVANTCLRSSAMVSHALAFYAQREREVYVACQQHARGFFHEAAAFHGTPFWSARSGAQPDELANEVRCAHEQLRQRPHIALRVSPALRFETAPEIQGREVVLRDAIVMPGDVAPIRFAAGVNLPALVRIATQCEDVPAILSAYHTRIGPAPPDNLITGLSLLVARHALILEEARS